MRDITFEIDGEVIPIEFVWAHLQCGDVLGAKGFSLTVPTALVNDVFDPTNESPKDRPIETNIQELISEFGSFIVDGYLNNIRRLQQVKVCPFRWVIATVQEIESSGEGIIIHGKAIPFTGTGDPEKMFKRLE